MSDWGATHDSASDNANAGLDMEQPGDYIVVGRSISLSQSQQYSILLRGGGVFGGLESAVNSGSVSTDVWLP